MKVYVAILKRKMNVSAMLTLLTLNKQDFASETYVHTYDKII